MWTCLYGHWRTTLERTYTCNDVKFGWRIQIKYVWVAYTVTEMSHDAAMDTSEDREYEIEKICGQIVANGTTHYQSVNTFYCCIISQCSTYSCKPPHLQSAYNILRLLFHPYSDCCFIPLAFSNWSWYVNSVQWKGFTAADNTWEVNVCHVFDVFSHFILCVQSAENVQVHPVSVRFYATLFVRTASKRFMHTRTKWTQMSVRQIHRRSTKWTKCAATTYMMEQLITSNCDFVSLTFASAWSLWCF